MTPCACEDIEITPEYDHIRSRLESGCPLLFVSGKAGSGKTTLIHYLRENLEKNIVVVAPTGVAALNVGGATIHSFFRLPPRILSDDDIKEVRRRAVYQKIDILIIDEISMVRADVLDAVERFLRLNGPAEGRPFGGVQVLLVGDLFQLPPVIQQQEEDILVSRGYETPYFFSAKVLRDNPPVYVELSKIFRQTNEEFTGILDRVRLAADLQPVIAALNRNCYLPAADTPSLITLTCTNAVAERMNRFKLGELPGEQKIFEGELTGKFDIQRNKLPAPLKLALKLGAQVMFTKNDEQKRWVNGTIGRVVDFQEEDIRVELLSGRPGAVHDVHRVKWETFRYIYDPRQDRLTAEVIGEYAQFPLMLAWAVTIHKAQGKTLEKVRVDLGEGAFAPGQVYVALSRCRSLSDITLARPVRPAEITCDRRIRRFYDTLAEKQEASAKAPP